jgi:ATP-dependent 26S proteasome regulatory subunit
MQSLVTATEGFSGAEVVSVVQEAAMVCIERNADVMGLAELHAAAASVKPQITAAMISFYTTLQDRFK